MNSPISMMFKMRGKRTLHFTDMLAYLYLTIGTIIMPGPVVWGVFSSFKTPSAITRFPPEFLPYAGQTVPVSGYEDPLPLYDVTLPDGTVQRLAQMRRIGLERQFVDPAMPDSGIIKAPLESVVPVQGFGLAWENYIELLQQFDFVTYFRNSIVVTLSAALLTLLPITIIFAFLQKYIATGIATTGLK